MLSSAGSPLSDPFDARGALSEEQSRILATLALTALAIEARVNHLIEEQEENGTIHSELGAAARRLPPRSKWFLLPQLAGKAMHLDASKAPHQAVAQKRNDLLHVNYKGLKNKLPSRGATLSYFHGFVEAMADMNVVLGRWPVPRPELVRKLTTF